MLLLLPALVLAAEPYEFTFPASEKALDLTASKGTLKLSTGGSAITIRGTHEGDQTMCKLQTSTDDGAVARYEENGNSSVERDCITNMEVTVPTGTGVHVTMGQGTLDVQLDGSLQGNIATGDVKGKVTGAVNLVVGQGNVVLGGMTAPAEVKVSSGNAAMVFDKAPEGAVLVTVAMGNVFLDFPDGTELDARVPSGVQIPFPQKTSATTKLMVGRTQGEVVIE